MWKSLGDHSDIIKHQKNDYPRRISTNVYAIATLVINFILLSYTFKDLLLRVISIDTYDIICIGVLITSILLICGLFVAKYFLNKKEIDIALIFISIVLIIITTTH